MEEIKAPKKERKFLKAMGDIALTLFRELVLGIGKKVINKVGNKRQGLVIAFALVAGISYASIDSIPYPLTGNKQRLGWQTSGNGLVYRGRSNDTITKPSSYVDKNVKAYLLVDSVLGTIFVWRQTYWDSIKVNTRLMPFDSITFNTAKNGTVGVGEVEYNDTQGSLIQGLKGGNVTNVIGQQLHQQVNNRTGAPLAKGDVVYLAGSQGNRITVAKGLAVSDAFSANTFGVVAESIADNQSGFIITEGLITGLNTSALTEDSAVYLSPTVPGALTSTKPQAPQHTVYIGVCVKSNNGSGELFVKIRNGQELDELHDTRISNPVSGATLYYSGGLWRDTTAALLVSDTASMLSNYATKAYADTTGRLYARQDYTTGVTSSTLTWTQSDTLIPGGVTVVQVYRNGQILLPSQYTIPTSTSVVIAASSFKVNDNYTVIFPRGGGAGSGGGSGSLTSISAGTGITVSPNPITTTGVVSADLSILMELTDTSLLNLTTRFASKLNTTDTASLSNRIDAKGNGTVTSVATGYGLTGGTITTTGTLVLDSAVVFSRIRDSIVDVAIGNDTIKILKQEYAPATTSVLTWTVTPKFPIQLKQYILVFRNGQLLINDQYNLTDTNKITIVSNSFKVGANYTVVTVSGIGSVGTGIFPNPVYPNAGIALSTGTTWASSIPNNSTNWNTAFTDRLKWDGGSTGLTPSTGRTSLGGTTIGQSMFTLTNPSTISFPRFNADNTVTALSAASFRSAIGAGTVTSVNVAAGTPISITNNTTTPEISMAAATGSINGYLTSTDWTTFNNKQNQLNGTGFVKASGTSITYDNSTYLTTGTAASTYLPLTGGTLTGELYTKYLNTFAKTTYVPFNAGISEQSIFNVGTTLRGGTVMVFPDSNLVGSSANIFLANSSVQGIESSAMGSGMRNYAKQGGDTRRNSLAFYTSGIGSQNTNRLFIDYDGNVGINDDTPSFKLDVNGTLNATGATTLGSTLAVTGNITEAGNNVLTNLDTISLSNRINAKGNGTVTNVSGSGAISVATGTTTPVIIVADAAFGTAGIVTASGTQQFSGDKTFEGITQFNARAVFKDYTYVATRLAGLSSTDRFATVTIGSGLSLSSGTLSATGGSGTVTNVTGTLPISVANGTTTPSITIADAGTGASGVVNTGTQSFAGNKTFTGTLNVSSTGTFGGRINTPWLERTYTNSTSSSFTVSVNTTWLDVNTNVLTTLTLPNASTYPGKELHIRQTGTGQIISFSSNVIPFTSPPTGSAGTAILNPTNNKAVTLVSDGTNWIIMQRSGN